MNHIDLNADNYEEFFPLRLAQLRLQKNVSAREMSLALGQNSGYINNIETGRALPSMAGFFYICEYLDISPRQYFEIDVQNPVKVSNLANNLKKLTDRQLDYMTELVKDLTGD